MAYVCDQLSAPALITGQQTCQKWSVQQDTVVKHQFLPELTIAQGIAIGSAIFAVLAFTAGVNYLITMIKRS
jgi:hypothetical protein